MQFKDALIRFGTNLERLTSHGTTFSLKDSSILDYSEKKKAYHLSMLKSSYRDLLESAQSVEFEDLQIKKKFGSLMTLLVTAYQHNDIYELKKIIIELLELEPKISYKSPIMIDFKITKLPKEIATDMNEDLKELERCFSAGCYRASVILCGRLIETALHRKFYDSTGQDILEKNPGIGLGNLIAKLKEKNISLDPAITQQVHLVNQVRIYSVHTKKEAFTPSKDQTQAIILYTLDIIRKLF